MARAIRIAFALIVLMLTSALGFANAFAIPCPVSTTGPLIETVHSALAALPAVGEHLLIVDGVSSACNIPRQLVGITEVSSSDNITEYISMQTFELHNQTTIGASWVPLHQGEYNLRFFVVDNASNPSLLSNVALSNVTANAYQPLSVVSILPAPYPPIEKPDFLPQNITVVIGVNETIMWTNGDTAGHVLACTKITGGNQTIALPSSGYVESGFGIQYAFTSPGFYEYRDKANPWMYGFIQVLPESHQ